MFASLSGADRRGNRLCSGVLEKGTSMNILVTGGSGFLGSHVVDKLIEAGHKVRVLDLKRPDQRDVDFLRETLPPGKM